MRWYRKAADQGNAAGQAKVGWSYEHGEGVAQDYNEAMRWYRKAADQGNVPAQFNCGDVPKLSRCGAGLRRGVALVP
jgi:TPR repeat protein